MFLKPPDGGCCLILTHALWHSLGADLLKCSEPGSVCAHGFPNIWVLENYCRGTQHMMVPRCFWRSDACEVPKRAQSLCWCSHMERKEETWVHYLRNGSLNEPFFSLLKYLRKIWKAGTRYERSGKSALFSTLLRELLHSYINGPQQGWFSPRPHPPAGVGGGAFGRVWRHFWLSHLERSTGMEQREARSGDNQPTYTAQDSFPRQKYSSSKHQCCRRWKPNTLHKPSCTHAMLHPKSGVETRGQWIGFVFSLIIVIEIIKQKCSIKRRRQS